MNFADILLGRAPDVTIPTGRRHVCEDDEPERPAIKEYAKYGFPCGCGCGRITVKYQVVKGMRKLCYMRIERQKRNVG